MKNKILLAFGAILLLLAWAALDDITTGKEPSFTGEYLILIIDIPVLIMIVYSWIVAFFNSKV